MIQDFQLQRRQGKNAEAHSLTRLFIDKGISSFREACDYVRHLPYGRPVVAASSPFGKTCLAVLEQRRGTCSSKHGLLKALAEEQGAGDIKLMRCLFLMDGNNTPGIREVVSQGPMPRIPEAHAYLRWHEERIDATKPGLHVDQLLADVVLEEETTLPELANKTVWHRDQLQRYLERYYPSVSLEAAWAQREAAIATLSS